MSERYERTSERTNEWPSTYIPIHGCSAPLWGDAALAVVVEAVVAAVDAHG